MSDNSASLPSPPAQSMVCCILRQSASAWPHLTAAVQLRFSNRRICCKKVPKRAQRSWYARKLAHIRGRLLRELWGRPRAWSEYARLAPSSQQLTRHSLPLTVDVHAMRGATRAERSCLSPPTICKTYRTSLTHQNERQVYRPTHIVACSY